MDRERAKQYIISNPTLYLQQDKSKKGYICPICGSGNGKNGTGITTKDKIHFTCWAGCFTNADIIDIIGMENELTSYNEKLAKACEVYNITLEQGYSYSRASALEDFGEIDAENQNQDKTEQNTHTQSHIHNSTYTNTEEQADYTSFFRTAHQNIAQTDYYRGLSRETLDRFLIGYIAEWRHPDRPKAPLSPRLIIPTSKYSYLARDTRAELTEEQKKYSKMKVGKVAIFNKKALKTATKPIIIVEGELDALSLIEVGGEAIALGSTANRRALITLLEGEKPSQPLIIAMDNDEAGERAKNELITGFQGLNITFYVINPCEGYKDANEALIKDREALTRAVEQINGIEEQAKEAEKKQLQRETASYSINGFMDAIERSKTASFIPTGFPALDNLLDGGLYAGLYIIGAISSLGKTTFCLQIADQIAQRGEDVLIFSLEMAKNELIAKSVSRLTFIKDKEINKTTANAKTTRGILTGTRYADYSETETSLIASSIQTYSEYGSHIIIAEGMGNIGIAEIKAKVEQVKRIRGKAPVVLIDYLQIIAPADIRATDKQNTDKAVTELKLLSRDYNIPVIGISSFNRDNYTAPVNLASFKESGAIEYSSDVLIGLQYLGMDFQEGERADSRDKRIRELIKEAIKEGQRGNFQKIQIKILKNRNGSKGDTVIRFYPMFNYFLEEAGDQTEEARKVYISSPSPTIKPPKLSKRDQARADLNGAFFRVKKDGKAKLIDLADALDKSQAQIQRMIRELGGYKVEGDTVTTDSPNWIELTDEIDLESIFPATGEQETIDDIY